MSIDCLPDELLDRIFDFAPLGLSDIVRASHVSARWRRVARAHPTFCRHIDFVCGPHTPHSAELCFRLLTQVGCSRLPLHLTIGYQGDDAFVLQTLVSVIIENMHRVVSLELTLPMRQRHHILTVLNQPAPQLTRLHVHARQWVSIWQRGFTVPLPPALFGAGSRLDTLSLYNLDFPAGPGNALPSLTHLTFHDYCPNLGREVEAALSACPRLRRLDFVLNSRYGAAHDLEPLVRDVMHIPSVAQLHNVSLHAPVHIEASYAHIIPHLSGALHLELSDLKLVPNLGECSVALVERQTGRVRRMEYQALSLISRAAERFAQLGLASRIVQLAVWIRLLDIPAKLFPALPRVEILIIHLHAECNSDEAYGSQTRSLAVDAVDEPTIFPPMPSCPSLEKIVMTGRGQQCNVGWLVKFIDASINRGGIRGSDARLKLELRDVTLVGDPHSLRDHFSDV